MKRGDINSGKPSRLIDVPGFGRAAFAEFGDPEGFPVLALHGAPACGLMFALADEEARLTGLRLIAPDRPGYAGTPVDTTPTLASRTRWHAAIADALELDRFAILAISGGGPYATALASHLGPRIAALALVSPMGPVADYMATPLGRSAPMPFLQRRFFIHLPRRFFFPALGQFAVGVYTSANWRALGNVPRLIGEPDAGILDVPRIRDVMVAMTNEALLRGADGGIADMQVYSRPWDVDFARICAPAMLWQGMADRIVPVGPALHLAKSIPTCELIAIEGAGHFWVFEHVTEVCNSLRELIDRAETSADLNVAHGRRTT